MGEDERDGVDLLFQGKLLREGQKLPIPPPPANDLHPDGEAFT